MLNNNTKYLFVKKKKKKTKLRKAYYKRSCFHLMETDKSFNFSNHYLRNYTEYSPCLEKLSWMNSFRLRICSRKIPYRLNLLKGTFHTSIDPKLGLRRYLSVCPKKKIGLWRNWFAFVSTCRTKLSGPKLWFIRKPWSIENRAIKVGGLFQFDELSNKYNHINALLFFLRIWTCIQWWTSTHPCCFHQCS